MAGERRGGGLEITSPQAAPGGGRARAPGEVIFDLVFSNESLWSTVDPHGAQTLVEKSIADKGVVDLGDLMREFVDRKTKPDLARGTVLAFAMELARAGVAIRLPAELQSLDRTSRQKLVDVFRAGQKSADEPTKTLAQPSGGPNRTGTSAPRPPSTRTTSGSAPSSPPSRASSPPSRSTTPPVRTEDALDGWSQGLGAVTDARSASKSSGVSKSATGEASTSNRPARAPTEAGRERSRTNIERPRAAEGLAYGAMLGPGRIAALVASVLFVVIGLVVGPRGSVAVPDSTALPSDIPCSRLEKNGPHLFCVVDLESGQKRLTLDDIAEKKAKMVEAARKSGFTSLTFFNPDKTRWDPAPIAVDVQPARATAAEGEEDRAAASDFSRPSSTPTFADDSAGDSDDEEEIAVEQAPMEVLRNEDGSVREPRPPSAEDEEHSGHGSGDVVVPAMMSDRGRAQTIRAQSSKKKKKR